MSQVGARVRETARRGARRTALLLVGISCFACSTGDPDTAPADTGGRILRTPAHVDSQLNQAREHIRTIDTLGAGTE